MEADEAGRPSDKNGLHASPPAALVLGRSAAGIYAATIAGSFPVAKGDNRPEKRPDTDPDVAPDEFVHHEYPHRKQFRCRSFAQRRVRRRPSWRQATTVSGRAFARLWTSGLLEQDQILQPKR